MNSENLLSIIIPVYNAEKYLRACIDSCLCQKYENFELVAVNDGSKDESLVILREYESIDFRVRVFDKPNEGASATRQYGIQKANGRYLFFMDSDDTIAPNALSVLIEKAKETNADIVIGNLRIVLESGRIIGQEKNSFAGGSKGRVSYLQSIFSKSILPSLCGRLFRRDLFDEINLPSEYPIGEDVMVNLLMAEKYNPSVILVDDVIYSYIQHSGSMINVHTRANANKRLKYMSWVYDYFFKIEQTERHELKNAFDKFIIEEYFSFLRDGGSWKECTEINDYVNNVGMNNSVATSKLPLWRINMIKSYRMNVTIGNVYRYFFIKLRSVLR